MTQQKSVSAIFLDRDGVINVPPGRKRYITRPEEFRFLPGSLRAIAALSRGSRKLIVISNQAGVERRIFSRKALEAITRKMRSGITAAGGRLDAIYYCRHRPNAGCGCRKPNIGLIRRAQQRFPIALTRSFFVGDSAKDIRLGQKLGIRTVLVLTGEQTRASAQRQKLMPEKIVKNLSQAARWIQNQ